MSEAPQTSANESKAEELQRAFAVFNQVSHELTQAYMALQARVESLTSELAVANGELRRQYQEKEALSERLSLLLLVASWTAYALAVIAASPDRIVQWGNGLAITSACFWRWVTIGRRAKSLRSIQREMREGA